MNYLIVGIGGLVGSMARYGASSFSIQFFPQTKFPVATFLINLAGCFLIGIVAGLTERLPAFNAEIRLLSITGFLGGFTTFSAFGIESYYLLRSGEMLLALVYAVLSVVLGILLVGVGLKVTGA